jgi:hypothetical protein
LTRRATLAAAPLAVVAGCRWGPAEEDSPDLPAPEPDADAAAVHEAAEATRTVLDLVRRVAADHIGLSASLAGLVGMHTAHLALLEADPGPGDEADPEPGDEGDGEPPADVPLPNARAALARVRADELALQATLARLALSASSGTFARALASMSAAVAQHVAVLPSVARGPA